MISFKCASRAVIMFFCVFFVILQSCACFQYLSIIECYNHGRFPVPLEQLGLHSRTTVIPAPDSPNCTLQEYRDTQMEEHPILKVPELPFPWRCDPMKLDVYKSLTDKLYTVWSISEMWLNAQEIRTHHWKALGLRSGSWSEQQDCYNRGYETDPFLPCVYHFGVNSFLVYFRIPTPGWSHPIYTLLKPRWASVSY